jgi:uncharacterized membrane protein
MAQTELLQDRSTYPWYGNGRASALDEDSEIEATRRERQNGRSDRARSLGRKLGWFSIGLGAAEMTMPGAIAKLALGRDDAMKRLIVRALGAREIAVGIGLLARPSGPNWMFARVAGDVMDLAVLGLGASRRGSQTLNAALTAVALAGVTALDFQAGRTARRAQRPARARYDVRKSVVIECTPEEAYTYWRDVQKLPTFMTMVAQVEAIDDRRSHWSVRGPGGADFSWDSEIIQDQPNQRIAWRTLPGAPLPNTGEVRFIPLSNGRGTEVRLGMSYDESSSKLLSTLGKVFSKGLEIHVRQDLRRFKQLMEVGEIVKSDASIHDGPHPAQPSARGGVR